MNKAKLHQFLEAIGGGGAKAVVNRAVALIVLEAFLLTQGGIVLAHAAPVAPREQRSAPAATIPAQLIPAAAGATALPPPTGAPEPAAPEASADTTLPAPSLSLSEAIPPRLSAGAQPAEAGGDGDHSAAQAPAIPLTKTATAVVEPGKPTTLALGLVRLEVPSGALAKRTTIEVQQLPQVKPMDEGMENVTGGVPGYRFTPHGLHFAVPVRLTIPYDTTRIKPEDAQADLYTYFYNTEKGYWQRLPRLALDTKKGLVTSLTTHFTDFVNSTLSLPNSPKPLSYNPNSIKDIKAANPGSGITLIDPPTANNQGTANLRYPITLPPGRAGMTPQLAITYNSSGGDGWMGLGWSLDTSSITVDTRWGVPRYDSKLETESYLLDGQELTPLANRTAFVARSTGDKTFETRIEGSFRRIIRHGTSPSGDSPQATYWWEVTDKTGREFFYGGLPESGFDSSSVVEAPNGGGVYTWLLREERDTNGNTIDYSYVQQKDTGFGKGFNVYLSQISYTGTVGSPGPYTVTFVRDHQMSGWKERPDVTISARSGFVITTADLLTEVNIAYGSTPVRSYSLAYKTGAFDKTVLSGIAQVGVDGSTLATHTFTYYDTVDSPSNGMINGFATTPQDVTIQTSQDDPNTLLLLAGDLGTALGSSSSQGVGGDLYLGYSPTYSFTKSGSVGFKVGFTSGKTHGQIAMVDLSGAGKPDKVFVGGDGNIYYEPNLTSPDGPITFGSPKELEGLPNLLPNVGEVSEDDTTSTTLGAENYIGVQASADVSTTVTTGSAYFEDANGDGLMDFVYDGVVYFNHIDPATDVPDFTLNSADTPVPINAAAGISFSGSNASLNNMKNELLASSPLADSVREWIAPFAGTINIAGSAQYTGCAPAQSTDPHVDGVRVAIQHNGTELWAANVGGPNYASSASPTAVTGITVATGDRIYFRVGSIYDGSSDCVNWDPAITYTSISGMSDLSYTSDANNLDFSHYQASQDFVYAGREGGVQMPYTGQIQVSGTIAKRATSDDLTLEVIDTPSQTSGSGTNPPPTPPPVFTLSIPAGAATIPVSTPVINVTAGDTISLTFAVDSPVDVTAISWSPKITYSSASGVNLTSSNDSVNAMWDINLYPDSRGTGDYVGWLASEGGSQQTPMELQASMAAIGLPGTNTTPPSGPVYFTVKRGGQLLAETTMQVVNGVGTGTLNLTNVQQNDRLYVELTASDPSLVPVLDAASVSLVTPDPSSRSGYRYTPVPVGLHAPVAVGLIGQPYRGWAYFAYNGSYCSAGASNCSAEPLETQAIVEGNLDIANNKAAYQGNSLPPAWVMVPDPADQIWKGQSAQISVSATGLQSTRIGDPYPNFSAPSSSGLTGTGAVGVVRMSISTQQMLGATIVVSGTVASGQSVGTIDSMDLNGDGYPSIIAGSQIQYTLPTGGLDSPQTPQGFAGNVRQSNNVFGSLSIGGNVPLMEADSQGKTIGTNSGGSTTEVPVFGLGLSLGLNLSTASSYTTSNLVDMTGDGLPDIVTFVPNDKNNPAAGGQIWVALNLGYSFATPVLWSNVPGKIPYGSTSTDPVNVGLSFNFDSYSFAGGVSLSGNNSESDVSLIDMNGDGLPDLVYYQGGQLYVCLNTGTGFAAPIAWTGGTNEGVLSKNKSESYGEGAYFTFAIPIPFFGTIVVNPGVSASQSVSSTLVAFENINGDGLTEEVSSDSQDSMTVYGNNTADTNLLEEVDRPLGGSFVISYSRTGNSYAVPQSKWVMTGLTINDGLTGHGVDSYQKSFDYSNGVYNRFERTFLGFGQVKTNDLNQDGSLYRTTEQDYLTDSYYDKGLLSRETVSDANGNLFRETVNDYVLYDEYRGQTFATSTPPDDLTYVFPELVETDVNTYDGGQADVSDVQTFTYDQYGNVIQSVDQGDPNTPSEAADITIQYTNDTAKYIVGKPTELIVTDSNGNILRKRIGTYDANGNLTQLEDYLAGGTDPIYTFSYDQYGNLTQEVDPVGYTINYTYDPDVATHIVKITDSFGYTSTAQYDLRFGLPTVSTDINGNSTTRVYDTYGRLVTVYGPYDQAGGTPALQFSYNTSTFPATAVTKNKIHFDPANTAALTTVLAVDGLERVIQTKKEGVISSSGGEATTYGMNVTGTVTFDAQQRVAEEGQPVFETGYDPGYWSGATLVRPTINQYDVLDRKTLVTLPDGSTIQTAYSVQQASGNTPAELVTTVIDPMGNKTVRFTDVRENTIEVDRYHDGQPIATTYQYDPISEITQVTDTKGNTTTVSYDTLGRRTAINNPDSGLTQYVYDAAGNLIQKITPNLRQRHQAITYTYQFDRLQKVTYPYSPPVVYTYGNPGDPNNTAGRIASVTDESGTRQFQYGKLGETVWTKKTLAFDRPYRIPDSNAPDGYDDQKVNSPLDNDDHPPSFITQFRYDYLGRMEYMVYPDGEQLTYGYDQGGQITTVTGVTTYGKTYDYVKAITYDDFGQRVFIHYGNGVTTAYTYDPNRRWLSHIVTQNARGKVFQNTAYTFDKVGDVLSVTNNGYKQVTQTYGYDDLYELTSAQGTYTRPVYDFDQEHNVDQYQQTFTYDTIGNMLTQTSVHTKVSPASPEPDQLNYTFAYQYNGPRPHAATQIGPWTVQYDANGNVVEERLTGSEGGDNGQGNGGNDNGNHYGNPKGGTVDNDGNFRFGHHEYGGLHGSDWGMQDTHYVPGIGPKDKIFVWDEENRLIHTFGFGAPTDYLYDYNGERALKRGEHGETWYIDRYYQIQNGHMIEKHIFVGDTRVVTRLEDSDFYDSGYEDHNIFYYHPDHLGSTTFVTTEDGHEWEHMEYTPYGQQWIDEGTDKSIIAYRFTSKEYDSETGLYYYGKRYLDPDGARWLTPDPAIQSYLPDQPKNDETRRRNLDLPGGGGVFNMFNLNLYGYSSNNPLKYLDPNGQIIDPFTSSMLMTDDKWAGVSLGASSDKVGSAGCFVTVLANLINTINGNAALTPGNLATDPNVVDVNGNVSLGSMQAALRNYTGKNLTINDTGRSSPVSIAAKLLSLQRSGKQFLVFGEASVYVPGKGFENHLVAINGAFLSQNGYLGLYAQPTSKYDVPRKYGVQSQSASKNEYRFFRLLYVEVPK